MADETEHARTAVIEVHIDTLAYTREGLKTHSPLPLELGAMNRVDLVRPTRRRSLAQGARGFPVDMAYPLTASLSLTWSMAKAGTAFSHHDAQTRYGGTIYQVFAHASESGDEGHNKTLSEKRARVGLALLTSDPALLREVADEEGWGLREHQAMLRTLACDPGPIDGEPGDRTDRAVELFQTRYNDDVFHQRHGGKPEEPLETDGDLGSLTEDALFSAFVLAHGAKLPEDAMHQTHPWAGCSEFNTMPTDEPSHSRRLVIVGHPTQPEHPQAAPCTQGDPGPCAVVDEHHHRCMYYREHVTESESVAVRFYDPRWMWLGDDRYLLSALTTLDGDCEVVFDVFDAEERVRGAVPVESAWVQSPRAEALSGVVRRGVAQVVWASGETPTEPDGQPPAENFPVFRVRDPNGESFVFCPWPERKTLRVIVGAIDVEDHALMYRLEANDGSYTRDVALADAVGVTGSHVAVEFPEVPIDARISLWSGLDGQFTMPLLRNVVAAALEGNCERGAQCTEVPLPVPPPEPAILDDDDDHHADDHDPQELIDLTHDLDDDDLDDDDEDEDDA